MVGQAGWGDGVFAFLEEMFEGDLHGKRVLSLANATLGVMVSASLAVSVIGQSLAQACGLLTRHAVKQVDRLLSNQGIDVWEIMSMWVPEVIGPAQTLRNPLILLLLALREYPIMVAVNSTFDGLDQSDGSSGGLG